MSTGQSLSSALWNALGVGAMLTIICSVVMLVALVFRYGHKAIKDIEDSLHDLDFTGVFVEPGPDDLD